MSIDNIRATLSLDRGANRRQHAHRHHERRDTHADLRQQEIAGMLHRQALPFFPSGHTGKFRILTEARRLEGEVRHRCDHAADHLAAGHQMAQAILDKDAMRRLRAVGIKRGEGNQPNRFLRTRHVKSLFLDGP
jgi:hypothetical protein